MNFTHITDDDLPIILEWLNRPHVAEWWGPVPTLDELIDEYRGVVDRTDSTRAYIARVDGRPVGFIQSYVAVDAHDDGWWLDETGRGVLGIDQFLANESELDRGLGTAMITAFVDMLLADPAVTRVQTDPAPTNGRAIRCYEKCGFVPERVVETPDGPALLMYRDRGR